MQVEKFIDEIFFDDYEVLTPDGFKDFKGIGKTVEFQEYIIHFKEDSKVFTCADEHIVILQNGSEKFVKDLEENDKILSSNFQGYLTVDFIEVTEEYSNMYDLLGVDGEIYNTSDIVSHNSTVTVGFALHQVLFNSYYNVFLLAHNHKASKGLLAKVKVAYENLEPWLQQGVVRMNDTELHLENGSAIVSAATTKTGVRSHSANLILCDELGFVEENIANPFFASTWPVISSGKSTKFFVLSTPNGFNLYHRIWEGANAKGDRHNGFKPIFVHWSKVPGRDEEWKKREIATVGQEIFNKEYECLFESSTSGLIKPEKIQELMANRLEPIVTDEASSLLIYEKPIKNEKYLMCVDTSKGIGGKGDYQTFQVIKVTKIPYEVVAIYRNNDISTLVFPSIIEKVGLEYNDADVFIENNEYGLQVGQILMAELEYPNLIFTQVTNSLQRISYGYDRKSQIGLRMTAAVKKIGCGNLKNLIEHNKLLIRDYETISELASFVRDKDSYAADDGKHDDLVMNLVLFAWLTTQDYFKDIEQNVGDDIRNIYESNIDQGLKAIGFLITGREDHDNSWYDEEEEKDFREGWRKVGETLDDDQLSLLGYLR